MRTSVPWGHTLHVRRAAWRHHPSHGHRHRHGRGHRDGRGRAQVVAAAPDLTESVRWAWGLMAMTLPAGLVAVLVVDSLSGMSGLSASGLWAGAVVYAAVVAPLVASIVIGLQAWRVAGEQLALRAAFVSAGVITVGSVLVLGTWLG